MGLFSFVGKALKAVGKVAGFVPGIGGVVGKVAGLAGNLLDAKQPMSTTAAKMKQVQVLRNPQVLRAKSPMAGGWMNATVLRQTPIMPGGAVSTPSGMLAANGGAPPVAFGGSGGGKRRSTKRRASAPRKRRKAKLKFGSAAWRKKYMPKRRRAA